MDKSSVGIVVPKDFCFGDGGDDSLALDCGKKLGSVCLRYETYGTLNANKSNAILILHALSGDAHLAGYHSEDESKPGWWDAMVGSGKALDTDKYFIVCSNVIGGCSGSTGPGSTNPETGDAYKMTFPVVTISDMVRAQYRLMKHLEIDKWLSVGGGSMGGMQALEWAVRYPDNVASVLAIATTSRISPQGIAFDWVGRQAIMHDPSWNGGSYTTHQPNHGLSTARMLAHITYLSDEAMYRKFGRKLQAQDSDHYSFDFNKDFAVESYLDYQGVRFTGRFDANSYLYITRAIDYFDISESFGGDLTATFAGIKSNFLVVSFSSDWLFPPYQSKDIVKALLNNGKELTYCNIDSSYGHDAFLLEIESLGALISNFLRERYREVEND